MNMGKIKQIFCRHEYRYIECVKEYRKAFVYQCKKCGKTKIVFCEDILHKMYNINDITAVYAYPRKRLLVPDSYTNMDIECDSSRAAYVVDWYLKHKKVLLTEYGNTKERNNYKED